MGLLDDAIREHLELKRLRGADPGDVAREENDALGAVSRESAEGPEGHEDDQAEPPSGKGGSFFPESGQAPVVDPSMASHVNQETVEINMDAELAAGIDGEREREGRGPAERTRADSVPQPARTGTDTEESLEWEMPGDAHTVEDSKAVEPVEDVLEETPDFLQDTPEQERLWFEQRPPRDFDFNE